MEQRSEEWFRLRRTKIGASDAPIIMGVGFKTPLQLWEQKLGIGEDFQTTPAMQRGIDLESMILERFNKLMGRTFAPTVRVSEELPWAMASLDGLCEETNEIVEIKCANLKDHQQAKCGFIPDKYYPQLQHQMFVCNLHEAYYCSYHDNDITITKVARDTDYIKRMIIEESKFMHCLEVLDPPPMTDRDFGTLSSDLQDAADELKQVMMTRRDLEKREAELKKILSSSVDRPTKGYGIRITKCVRKGSIDYESIPQLIGVNLEQYRKAPCSYWTFGIEG